MVSYEWKNLANWNLHFFHWHNYIAHAWLCLKLWPPWQTGCSQCIKIKIQEMTFFTKILLILKSYIAIIDKSINIVNFKLSYSMWKVTWSTWHEHETKENSESPTGIKPMTLQKPCGRSIHWAMRTHGEQGHLTAFKCNRCPAYCFIQYQGLTLHKEQYFFWSLTHWKQDCVLPPTP